MKLNTQAIIDAIDGAIATHENRAVEYEAARREYQKRVANDWLVQHLPRYRSLRDMLTKAIKSGTLITQDMVREALGPPATDRYSSSSLPYWNEPHSDGFTLDGKKYFRPTIDRKQLDSLRALLETVEDETVTTSALASLGYRHVRDIFAYVAANQGD